MTPGGIAPSRPNSLSPRQNLLASHEAAERCALLGIHLGKAFNMSDQRQGQTRPKFPLGRLLATPAALRTLQQNGIQPSSLLNRHVSGDWGDVHPSDAAANDRAVQTGQRIISSYVVGQDARGGNRQVIWLLTEADRATTTILLPGEY